MKKKIELNKKTIKRLTLKLEAKNDRKVAPAVVVVESNLLIERPTGGHGCYTSNPISSCL
jgi:hypothetical protein